MKKDDEVKTIKEFLFGANALPGHLLMILWGVFLTWIDIIELGSLPELGLMALAVGFVVFAPLLLPARAHDVSERWQIVVLTFATSTVFGVMLGVPTWETWLYMSGQPLVTKTSLVSVSLGWSVVAAIAVGISYWSVGQMSRGYQNDITSNFASLPTFVGRICWLLCTTGHPMLADELQKRLAMSDIDFVLGEGWEKGAVPHDDHLWSEIVLTVLHDARGKRKERLHLRLQRAEAQIRDFEDEFTLPVDVMNFPKG